MKIKDCQPGVRVRHGSETGVINYKGKTGVIIEATESTVNVLFDGYLKTVCAPTYLIPHVLPCPFCGHPPGNTFDTHTAGKWGFIVCDSCFCHGPETRAGYQELDEWKQDAINEWNNRT